MTERTRRITIVTNTLDAGGAEVQKVTLANALVDAGHRVRLLLLQRTGVLEPRLRPEVELVVQGYRRPASGDVDVLITGTTNTELFKGLISRLTHPRQRWIVAIHDAVGPGAEVPTPFRKLCLLLADRVLGLSAGQAAGLARYWRFRSDALVSNGADLHWAPGVVARRARTERFPYDLLSFGRLDIAHKGLDLLVEALRVGNPAWRIGIAGTGPDEGALRERVRAAGLEDRVEFLGYLEPRSAMALGRALVVLSRYEGQPMVLLEAAAAAVPVVASRWAGASSGEGTTVVDADDPGAVVRGIERALDGPIPRARERDATAMTDAYLQQVALLESRFSLLRPHLRRLASRRRASDPE